jgi:hypothetical protein
VAFIPFRTRRPDESPKEYDDAKAAYRESHRVAAQNKRDRDRVIKQDPVEMFKRNFDCNAESSEERSI